MARWSGAHASRYYHLLSQVAEKGHVVYVLQAPSRESGEANDIDVALPSHANVRVITVGMPQGFWHANFPLEKLLKKLVWSLRLIPIVKRLIREKRIDLLYVYNLPQLVYLLGRRPKVVFDYADDLIGMLETELSLSGKHPLIRVASACLRWMIQRADFVTCISQPLYDEVIHQRKCLIPNGANLPLPSIGNPPTGRQKKGIVVGYVGAFEYSMAIDLALEAAARLPLIEFLLVGAGRDFARILELVRTRDLQNITLTGALPHDEAMKMIDRMDICLNLFHKTKVSHAVSPLKLFEYMAYRKPIISNRLREIERIDSGFLFFADSVDEIVDTISYICSHPEEAKEKAEKGFVALRERFLWSKLAADFLRAVTTQRL